jgi:hypothetical protein
MACHNALRLAAVQRYRRHLHLLLLGAAAVDQVMLV